MTILYLTPGLYHMEMHAWIYACIPAPRSSKLASKAGKAAQHHQEVYQSVSISCILGYSLVMVIFAPPHIYKHCFM
jgi:hypothetical protein